jgi:uncharacterized protein (TIGR02421 family)
MSLKESDRILQDAAKKIRIFHYVNPVNEKEQKERFLKQPSPGTEPEFVYPPLEFSPEELLDSLQGMPVDGIEDPRLRRLYADRRDELVETVHLLQARGTGEFFRRSLDLVGRPPRDMVQDAEDLLSLPRPAEPEDLGAKEVGEMLGSYLDLLRERYPGFECTIDILPHMSSNMYVDENRIHIKEGARYSKAAADCDKHHEIEAHVLTYLNGLRQPLGLLRAGFRGSMAFQESLGVFTEIASGVMAPERAASLCSRVVAVDSMVRGLEFFEVFERLTEEFGFDPDSAYAVCQRVFRGGGFTKDWVYLAEVEGILRYWAAGGDLPVLLLGKATLEEADTVRELLDDGVLLPPEYLPLYLEKIKRPGLPGSRISLSGLFSLDLSQD